MSDVIVWADIPVVDMQRAVRFYSEVTGRSVTPLPGSGSEVAVIGGPGDPEGGVSADLYVGGTPSHAGATVYLGSQGDIDGMVARVVPAGGKVLQEKQFMGDMIGWLAFIEDSEGNRVGIHQTSESK